jgi:hypothetical protein
MSQLTVRSERAFARDNGPLSRLRLLRRCVAEVFAALKSGSDRPQRLLRLVLVDIRPSGGQLPANFDGSLTNGQSLFRAKPM